VKAPSFHVNPKDFSGPGWLWDDYDGELADLLQEAHKEAGTTLGDEMENYYVVGAEYVQAVHDALVACGLEYSPELSEKAS